MGTGRKRNVEPAVDEYPRALRVRQGEDPRRKFEQVSSREVLLSNLDHVDAGGQLAGDVLQEGFGASERAAIGDVVAPHDSTGS